MKYIAKRKTIKIALATFVALMFTFTMVVPKLTLAASNAVSIGTMSFTTTPVKVGETENLKVTFNETANTTVARSFYAEVYAIRGANSYKVSTGTVSIPAGKSSADVNFSMKFNTEGTFYTNVKVYDVQNGVLLAQRTASQQDVIIPSYANRVVPYYSQLDNKRLGSSTCNLTSLSMVLDYYGITNPAITGQRTPDYILDTYQSYENQLGFSEMYQNVPGLAWVFNDLATKAGSNIKDIGVTNGNFAELRSYLTQGVPVVVHGYFTNSGHVITVVGYDGANYIINDPWGEWLEYPSGYNVNGPGERRGEYQKVSAAAFENAIGPDGTCWFHLFVDKNTGKPATVEPVISLPTVTVNNADFTTAPVVVSENENVKVSITDNASNAGSRTYFTEVYAIRTSGEYKIATGNIAIGIGAQSGEGNFAVRFNTAGQLDLKVKVYDKEGGNILGQYATSNYKYNVASNAIVKEISSFSFTTTPIVKEQAENLQVNFTDNTNLDTTKTYYMEAYAVRTNGTYKVSEKAFSIAAGESTAVVNLPITFHSTGAFDMIVKVLDKQGGTLITQKSTSNYIYNVQDSIAQVGDAPTLGSITYSPSTIYTNENVNVSFVVNENALTSIDRNYYAEVYAIRGANSYKIAAGNVVVPATKSTITTTFQTIFNTAGDIYTKVKLYDKQGGTLKVEKTGAYPDTIQERTPGGSDTILNGIDVADVLYDADIAALKADNVKFVGRYYTVLVDNPKRTNRAEALRLKAAGIQMVTVYQNLNNDVQYFDYNTGYRHAQDAINQALALGQPKNTPIYFAVDFGTDITTLPYVEAYFQAVNDAMDDFKATYGTAWKIGVYGSYTSCNTMKSKGLATYSWQTLAWSGGMISNYNIYQYDIDINAYGLSIDYNRSNPNTNNDIGAFFPE